MAAIEVAGFGDEARDFLVNRHWLAGLIESSTMDVAGAVGEGERGLRPSCVRVGKHALIKHQRYVHAKQFKRAGPTLRVLRATLR